MLRRWVRAFYARLALSIEPHVCGYLQMRLDATNRRVEELRAEVAVISAREPYPRVATAVADMTPGMREAMRLCQTPPHGLSRVDPDAKLSQRSGSMPVGLSVVANGASK